MTQPFWQNERVAVYSWRYKRRGLVVSKIVEIWQPDDWGPRGKLLVSYRGHLRRLRALWWLGTSWSRE